MVLDGNTAGRVTTAIMLFTLLALSSWPQHSVAEPEATSETGHRNTLELPLSATMPNTPGARWLDQVRSRTRPQATGTIAGSPPPSHKTFAQVLDHFDAWQQPELHGNTQDPLAPPTFTQRYLVQDEFWRASKAKLRPIFVFTGAEGGNVEIVRSGYGHVVTMAKTYGALILWLEHRYFGVSKPFGNVSLAPHTDHARFLSVDQALADYAAIIEYERTARNAWANPVMTFGGSLAGTLAGLMRMRFPYLVDIALSSSSPLLGYPGLSNQYVWRKRITDTFQALSAGCPDVVRKGFAGIADLSPAAVSSLYRTCEGPRNDSAAVVQATAWGMLESMGEFVYPASVSPIVAACKRMREAHSPGQVFANLIDTPKSSCFNVTKRASVPVQDKTLAWMYLACTQITHPIQCYGHVPTSQLVCG
eukprot:m.214009 g.214009  ORF g.214009 m.214009 type:complete len:419 (-) comp18616_c1_seq2:478-1734(-)